MSEEIAQIRSAVAGRVRCPLKESYNTESVFVCQKCEYHKGIYQLPRTVAVACSKEYSGWVNSGICVLPLKTIKTLPNIGFVGVQE